LLSTVISSVSLFTTNLIAGFSVAALHEPPVIANVSNPPSKPMLALQEVDKVFALASATHPCWIRNSSERSVVL